MSNAIEIEAKALVSKADYEKLALKYKNYGIITTERKEVHIWV